MFFIRSSLCQEFPSHLDFTLPALTDLLRKTLELLIYLDFVVNCRKLVEWVVFECLVVVNNSCFMWKENWSEASWRDQSMLPLRSAETQSKYEAWTERYRWEKLRRPITSQAAWLARSVKREEQHGGPLKPGHGDKDVGKDPAAKSGQKFLRGGREQLRFLKAALQIKQSFVEMFKKNPPPHPGMRMSSSTWGWMGGQRRSTGGRL